MKKHLSCLAGNMAISIRGLTKMARSALGVCPAIDSQLNGREHLIVYGCLKGLTCEGQELEKGEQYSMVLL